MGKSRVGQLADQPSLNIWVGVEGCDLHRVGHQRKSGEDVGEFALREAMEVRHKSVEFGAELGMFGLVGRSCLVTFETDLFGEIVEFGSDTD